MSMNGHLVPPRSAGVQTGIVSRAEEANILLNDVKALVLDHIRSADVDVLESSKTGLSNGIKTPASTLLVPHPPRELQQLLDFAPPDQGQGRDGILSACKKVLSHSVNTWDQGFMDKLYHSTTPVGLASDLLLTSLNTNVHTYNVSPALTVIEKQTTRALATMFGFKGPFAGGIAQAGGSAANLSSIVVARNTVLPDTKTKGYGGRKFVLFTSAHGHYSLEKAAQICGFGSDAVRSIAVDEQGRMRPDALDEGINKAKQDGEIAFYVNATAGTTVYGSFDPLDEIADVCEKHGLWLHVDASWGGPVMFSAKHRHKLRGVERANSIAMCPHKMMGVPLTCSVLLGQDLRQFHRAMTLPAGYLFHDNHDDNDSDHVDGQTMTEEEEEEDNFWDLADLTPQCGRRGDMLKLALSWIYYGSSGYETYVDHGYEMATYLASLISAHEKFTLLSSNPPPCLQVCFYYDRQADAEENSRRTTNVVRKLIARGFMVDYAPGEEGKFFRVVVNGQTRRETLDRLVVAIEDVGAETR